jgi:hypothetical protein
MAIKLISSPNARGYKTADVNIDGILQTGLVAEQSRWCVWKALWQKGRIDKPAKIPCNATGKNLSVSASGNWMTFEETRKAYSSGRFDGIGLLMGSFSEVKGGLVGLDLDRCLNADGEIVKGATEVLTDFIALGGYIEYSPSGFGLRQFLSGVRLDDFKEKCKINGLFDLEIYDTNSDRYLTLTGVPYPTDRNAVSLQRNQKGLETFIAKWCERHPATAPLEFDPNSFTGVTRSASEVITLLRKYDKSGKATALLDGDLTEHPGHSEADLALCTSAAYFCRDPKIIDQVIRSSGLMREKWDRDDYRIRTIKKALAFQNRNYDANKATASDTAERQKEQIQKADKGLIGGVADLRTKTGWRRDLWALSELLVRDKRLLGVCFWDEFSGFPVVTTPLQRAFNDKSSPLTMGRLNDDHYRAVQAWFGREYGIALKREQVLETVARWSQSVRRNPAIERLNDLAEAWDGIERLDNWLIDYCGATIISEDCRDISEYVSAVGTRWLLSVVARAMKPGCKADAMLILEGKQGARKSSAVRVLGEAIGSEYFREGFHLGESSGKDARIALRGRLIIEWGELSGMGKKDRNELKTFLTQQVDSYRGVYGMTETDYPRTAVFAGTTNEGTYLSDPSGNRRFWPVKVRRVDIDRLQKDSEQIWAEAVMETLNKPPHRCMHTV